MRSRRKFIRQIGLATASISVFPYLNSCVSDAQTKSGDLPRSSPEAQGVSTEALHHFFDAIESSGQEFHGTMIVKNGHVIAEAWWEPYGPNHKMQLYSMSKSFTSTAIGFAQQEGLLNVEDQVIKYFPNEVPSVISENLEKLKIKHLLMMGVGMKDDSILTIEQSPKGVPWAKTFLALPIEFEPGTKFKYNSGASFMLANIIQNVTGMSAHDYLKPRLFEPLNITNSTWSENPQGINFGASHLRLTTEDMAKFGQFYLQKGKWEGVQLLNEDYVNAASSKQISNGNNDSSWAYGYGYQFWLNPPGGFRADGAFGQYSMVFPEINAVVAIASESLGKVNTMSLVWDVLYPELAKNEALALNESGNEKLKTRLAALTYPPELFEANSNLESEINGNSYSFETNDLGIEKITFKFSENAVDFDIKEESIEEYRISCGRNSWIKGDNYKPKDHSLFSRRRIDFDSKVAAAAGWQKENILQITLRLIETCHTEYLTCSFDGNNLTIKPLFSVQRAQGNEDGRAAIKGSKG